MADNTEVLGVRLNLQGLPETTSGLALAGAGVTQLGAQADAAAPRVGNLGKSTREVQAAMRMLPAQITDVVTSLASGMPVWLVAIQQGGQIKDSFGGIAPAFRAVTAEVTPMRVAIGGAAAVVGLLTLAYAQAQRENGGYLRSLAQTGNAIGLTVDQMSNMAGAMRQSGSTQREGAEMLNLLAGGGRVAARDLERLTAVSLQLERVLSQSVDTTARIYADLARSPLEASVKLTESTQHLTAATYEHIRALMDQGRTSEAASAAQNAYADAMAQRAAQVQQRLGWLETGWNAVAAGAKLAWDKMLDIGREDTLERKLAKAQQDLERMSRFDGQRGVSPAEAARRQALRDQIDAMQEMQRLEARSATGQGQAARDAQAYIKAREENNRWAEAALSNTEKIDKALQDYRRNNEAILRGGGTLDPAQVAREEAAIRKAFKPDKGPEDPYKSLNGEVQRRLELAQAEIRTGQELTQADRYRIETLARIAELEKERAVPAGLRQRVEMTAQLMREAEQQQAAAEAQADIERRFAQERAAATDAAQREVDTLERSRTTLENETAEIGLSARAIHERRQALEEGAIAALEDKLQRIDGLPAYTEEAELLREQIRLRREMQGLRTQRFERGQEQEEAEAARRRTEGIARSIEDGVVNGFRDGRGTADIFMRELKAQAARTLLRFPIQLFSEQLSGATDQILKLISGGLSGLFGGGFSAYDTAGYGMTSGGPGLADLGLGGGRAFGGGVGPGALHPVNEQGMPELLKVGGQSYLMMGAEGGQVTPLKSQSGGGMGGPVVINFQPQISIDARTDQAQVLGLVSQGLEASEQRLLEKMSRRLA